MKQMRFLKVLLLTLSVFALMGCGGGGGGGGGNTAQQDAIDRIEAYADTNGTNGHAPTAEDYRDAGVDLNGTSVDEINAYIATLDESLVDSEEDIQAIADAAGVWLVDTDSDGDPDYADTDDDNDGIPDAEDVNSTNPDSDGDGISDGDDADMDGDGTVDNGTDTDGDGINNAADTDDDNDGVLDADDAFPLDAAESVDTDGDGIGNNADTDDDGDGIADAGDAFPLDAAESVDTDGDGIGNNADTDDDGDGVSDADETAAGSDPLNANSIAFKGLAYNVVTSADTGRQWLDRNLGATMVCSKSRDDADTPYADDAAYVADQGACFGDYYQWGRKTNGHEKSDSAVSDVRLESDVDSGGMFIKNPTDWRTTPDDVLWYGKDATNSICPSGFEVPTFAELWGDTYNATGDNKVTNSDSAFKNFLHLPVAGSRDGTNGTLDSMGVAGVLWTSDIHDSGAIFMAYIHGFVFANYSDRVYAGSIRCIKRSDAADNTAPVVSMYATAGIGVDSNITVAFSEAMDRSTLTTDNIRLRKLGTQDYIPISIQETGMRAIIDPAVSLKYITDYVVEVTTDVKDRSGNAIVGNTINITTHESTFNIEFATTDELEFNGLEYKVKVSPTTGKHWLDRNLGATEVCSKSRDDAAYGSDADYINDQKDCFGDYYQWGRRTNGHEKWDSVEDTFLLNHDVDSGGQFILTDTDPYDWRSGQQRFLWTSANLNKDKVCPVGFKVPSMTAISNEVGSVDNRDDAFNLFLKLPVSGGRKRTNGDLYLRGDRGLIWSSTAAGTDARIYLYLAGSASTTVVSTRAAGVPVRCIEK